MKNRDNTFSVQKAEDSSGFLLWQVTTLWQRRIRDALVQYDLTHSQYVLMASLHWLTLHNREVTQIVLSRHSKIDPMTTSSVLKTLLKKGFVSRQEHATDTRAKTINITDEGKEIVKKAVVTVETIDREFFALLDNRISVFNECLFALIEENRE
ncbi:MAG: MarR family transcriptional regulator [Bacteroidales bacterium]|jgi:DNA-binding MarR family transcriptional regulator|nr:MarR family transcriptional regulator [Bacteroidales bacterium]